MSAGSADPGRSVAIGRDAAGNVIVTGDRNRVVVVQVTRALDSGRPEAPSLIGPNPYRGLASFRENDANLFFGREEFVATLWERFRALHDAQPSGPPPARILAILGPSGSGKSSVARAGLIPELARRPIPGRESLRVAVLTPGSHPLDALASVLLRLAGEPEISLQRARELTDELRRVDDHVCDGLRRAVDALPGIAESPVLFVVDQLEEIFTQCLDPREADALLSNLLCAARDRGGRCSVVVTLRIDFLEQLNRDEDWSQIVAHQEVIVPSMDRAQLRRAIEVPAKVAGAPLGDELVELLIEQAKTRERDQSAVLPLLQVALSRVWDGLSTGRKPADTLRDIGGVGGALASEAERLYTTLTTSADQAIVRRSFIRMVQATADIPLTRRTIRLSRLVSTNDDEGRVRTVLERFAAASARILTFSADRDSAATVWITHEALLQNWARLNQWIGEGGADLALWDRIEDASRQWVHEGRIPALLWRGPDLAGAVEFERRWKGGMAPAALAFIDASRKRERTERYRNVPTWAAAAVVAVLIGVAVVVWRTAGTKGEPSRDQVLVYLQKHPELLTSSASNAGDTQNQQAAIDANTAKTVAASAGDVAATSVKSNAQIQQIALIADENISGKLPLPELQRVAAALQKQIVRDFAPIWGISATVTAFGKLDDVPSQGYWPVMVGNENQGGGAVHLDKDGQPFALVDFTPDWTLSTSHEVLNMLTDPFGSRFTRAPSIDPADGNAQVDFLVEPCDPSQAAEFAYRIDGVVVSDFYTPRYFDADVAPNVRYSMTSSIQAPRQVLKGGYISWRHPKTQIWKQMVFFGTKPVINELGRFDK